MLPRDLTYLNYWSKSKSRKPLIIRGARQVGKSTLVKIFAEAAGLDLVEVNLERHPQLDATFATLDIEQIILAIEAVSGKEVDDKKSLLFLDEIQEAPQALRALRYFYEENPELRVLAAGSLLEFTLADTDFSMPVGRVDFYWLRPMSFREFLTAGGKSTYVRALDSLKERQWRPDITFNWPEAVHENLMLAFRQYTIVGGMPEAVDAFINTQKLGKSLARVQDNIIATYESDFRKYGRRIDTKQLQLLHRRLPGALGRKVKFSALLPDAKAARTRALIQALVQAGIAVKVVSSKCSGLPLAAGFHQDVFKMYWLDIGLVSRMIGLSWKDIKDADKNLTDGPLAEQFVVQEIIANDQSADPQPIVYWLREGKKKNAEVDFVIQKGRQIVPVEVKSGATGTLKSLAQFVALRGMKTAVKLSASMPTHHRVEQKALSKSGSQSVNYRLVELPIYCAGQLK